MLLAKRKRALLVGLNYAMDPSARLAGCVNDVRTISKYLISTMGYQPSQVEVLTDEKLQDLYKVSKEGLIDSLYALAIASWKDDLEYALFHYSGHGSQVKDLSSDESDMQDEGIVPVDFRIQGLLVDDQLRRIFSRFNPKTKIVCFFDCCHSGSILDLPFAYDLNKPGDPGVKQAVVGLPRIYCISGCLDNQVSMDSTDLATNMPAGAMTTALVKCLGKKKTVSLLQLQDDLNKQLTLGGYQQHALLTCSMPCLPTDCF